MSAVITGSRLSGTAAAFCGISVVVVAVGVAGAFDDSWINRITPYHNAGNWLFGLLLCGLVLVRFYWLQGRSWPAMSDDPRTLSRDLSRMVYLVVYSVVGTLQLLRNGESQFDAHDGLQAYLGYAVAALILVRALAVVRARIDNRMVMSSP